MRNSKLPLKTVLPAKILRIVKLINNVAQQNGCDAFLVGGLVRDILLGIRNVDLDVLIEGDAARVADGLVKKTGGSCVLHQRFGTATISLPGAIKIDLASARKEFYEKPAALPTVAFSTVREDLLRRDFTINAMAASIADGNFGQLIDFYDGQNDLASKKIRILHDASFIDDPTRILRAVRFEQRLDFKIEPHTEKLIKDALNERMLDKTEKQRLRDELILILKEDRPEKIFKRMQALGALRFIHPKLCFTGHSEKFFDSIKKTVSWVRANGFKKMARDPWLIYLMALLDEINEGEAKKVCSEFVFTKSEQARMYSYKKDRLNIVRVLERSGRVGPSEIYKLLKPFSGEAILAIMARSPSGNVRKRVSDFLKKYNEVELNIKGADLKALGLKAGPDFKKILTAALYAKLDKGLKNKKQERDFVKKEFC